MKSGSNWRRLAQRWMVVPIAIMGLLPAAPQAVAAVQIGYLEGLIPKAPDAVATLGPSLFGDEVNLYNGALSFVQTDLSVPGNSALPVSVHRRYVAGRPADVKGQFGDWDLETPRVGGTFAFNPGWVSQVGGTNRCSAFSAPPTVTRSSTPGSPISPLQPFAASDSRVEELSGNVFYTAAFLAPEYWQGHMLHVPGHPSQEILRRSPSNNLRPLSGGSWPLVTRAQWQIDCLPNIQNGAGEGFVALSPDGVRYRFDWMATRFQPSLKKNSTTLSRMDVFLMATEVTDRFGNWVRYVYDPASPMLLVRIEASDGRNISIVNVGGRVSSMSDGSRTFHYAYSGPWLNSVQQPDGSRWQFNLAGMTPSIDHVSEGANCDSPGSFDPSELIGTMTHPSGAVGTFVTRLMAHGRTNVPRHCKFVQNSNTLTYGAVWSRRIVSQTMVSKRIDGAGLSAMTWSYNFAGPHGWTTCTGCSPFKTTTVRDPDGSESRHVFGNRFRIDEGLLMQSHFGWDGGSALRSTYFRYRSAEGQAYPDQFGTSVMPHGDDTPTRNRPQDRVHTVQQGSDFVWELAAGGQGLDAMARPLTVTKSSSLGFARTETRTYRDNAWRWVMGAVSAVAVDGKTVESYTYDDLDQPKSKSAFGRLMQSFAYYEDGNLSRVNDAAGQSTWLNQYLRGQPQQVVFADGHSASQVINNLGQPLSITNAAGTSHQLAYDAMGRLRRIDYPQGDPVTYHPSLIGFEQVWHDEFGLAPGHWRQTKQTGNAVVTRYFDALWRERLRWERDVARPHDTSSFVETRYDPAGRKTFTSYAERSFSHIDAERPGVRTVYDALGRPTSQTQDSELGKLTRLSQYVAPFQRQDRNERGFWTTFAFQAFDEPREDGITHIWMPEGVNVAIQRDVFGKARAITRSGASGPSATRRYVYDTHERLCKTIEPETGATVQDYDAAGNLAWTASGLSLPDTHQCQREDVPAARKIMHGYDSLNRLVSTQYGDGSPGVTRNYTPDGLPSRVASTELTWTYHYNNRRHLRSEWLSWPTQAPGSGWNFDWATDAYGHVAGLVDPWGWMPFDPDALGRPTRAGNYATQAVYHPNGALAHFVYGNGKSHVVHQNARGLPGLWLDSGVLQYRYHYDAAGNVASIGDEFEGLAGVSMQYDALDRLTVADGRWGFGSFQYDALDNITHSSVGHRSLTHHIDPGSQRVVALTGSQNIGIAYDANGNVSQRGGQAYQFDLGNRLRLVSNRAWYQYDGHGRRHWIGRPDGSGRLSAYGLKGQLMFSWDSGHGHTRYVSLGQRLVAELGEGGVVTYQHTDALGSPVARSDQAGQVVSRTRYEPYGGVTEGHVPMGVGYTGHVNDADTGLVYMQQRYYDPIAGRFLSVDQVTTDATTGGSFNRYVYGNNNPFKFTDPDGRFAFLAPLVYYVLPSAIVATGAWGIFNSKGKESAPAPSSDPQPGTRESSKGCVYRCDGVTPGQRTPSGRPYVGTADVKADRAKGARDGRERDTAPVVGEYEKGDTKGRREAEQNTINDNGGKEKLDNKRNEVAESKWKDRDIKPPKE